LYDDVAKNSQFTINATSNIIFNTNIELDIGFTYKNLNSRNYAEIGDLFGSDFHEDIDVFSNTINNIGEDINKVKGDIFNYNYNILASETELFAQLKYSRDKWSAFLSSNYFTNTTLRDGLYRNERFLDNSQGKSNQVNFSGIGAKTGFLYKLNGRNWLSANGALLQKAPILQNIFINPRENNNVVNNLTVEQIGSVDVSYFLRFPKLIGRVTGFYTHFKDETDVNFFFVDSGVGSDFVQEVLTGVDKLHIGAELGLEYQISPTVQLTGVVGLGKYTYHSNPNVLINFDTAGAEEDLINLEGNLDLGKANLKDYRLAQGPQKAFSIGVNYRDPKYWWLGLTANYLADNYANLSTITRTNSFYLNPETNQVFPDATEENVTKLLQQRSLDNFYLSYRDFVIYSPS